MNICLLCNSSLISTDSWGKLLSISNPPPICEECFSKLERIEGETCKMCDRPFAQLALEYRQSDLCNDCVKWLKDHRWKHTLVHNRSVFIYNPFMKEVISLFKFRGDHALSQIFQSELQRTFKKYYDKKSTIVPIPLSKERLYERGFNQAKVLANLLNLPIIEPLSRIHKEKQSKKSRQERIESESVFTLSDSALVTNQSIILIDDIYTTGTTIRHAAEILLESGASSVSSLTLARG